ncbi:MAG TPA: HAD-IB family phosphatase [Candidatus Acidoferrales bacterium]|nr:HAD-IB family phosphatase [Candidatus Acidoferrales bacterium]
MNPDTKIDVPRIAAFFDLDGTLLPSPSLEWRFAAFLLSRDEISAMRLARWLLRSFRNFPGSPRAAFKANKSHLACLRTTLAADWERSLHPDALPVFSRALDRIRWHATQQHAICFVSGTLDPLARVVADGISAQIGAPIEVIATRLESCGGYWTGDLAGEHMRGEAKARAIRAFASRCGCDLSRSFAYGDEIAEIPMLRAVGHPFTVNPSSRLERAARLHGWRVLEWRKLDEFKPPVPPGARGISRQFLSPRLIP